LPIIITPCSINSSIIQDWFKRPNCSHSAMGLCHIPPQE
jgi:hypothetical protein